MYRRYSGTEPAINLPLLSYMLPRVAGMTMFWRMNFLLTSVQYSSLVSIVYKAELVIYMPTRHMKKNMMRKRFMLLFLSGFIEGLWLFLCDSYGVGGFCADL